MAEPTKWDEPHSIVCEIERLQRRLAQIWPHYGTATDYWRARVAVVGNDVSALRGATSSGVDMERSRIAKDRAYWADQKGANA